MRRRMPRSVKILLVVNCLALVGFTILLFVQPMFTELAVLGNYTQLDRGGVINEDALGEFHPDYGFTQEHHRISVPWYIAGPALRAQWNNALAGITVVGVNLAVAVGFVLTGRGKSTSTKGLES